MVDGDSIFPYSHLELIATSELKPAMIDEILTLRWALAHLKLAEKTAYRLAQKVKLPGFKVGGSWRFKRENVQNWIEEQKDNQK